MFLYIFFSKKTHAEISRRMHRRMSRDLSYETDSGPKTKTVSDLNFQVMPTATTTAARRQLSHLARALDHHAQGPNIPFGVNPSLRYYIYTYIYILYIHIPLSLCITYIHILYIIYTPCRVLTSRSPVPVRRAPGAPA